MWILTQVDKEKNKVKGGIGFRLNCTNQTFDVGRQGCSIHLQDKSVSRKHAVLKTGTWENSDLINFEKKPSLTLLDSSTFGCWVNKFTKASKMEKGKDTQINSGDVIRFGVYDSIFLVEFEPLIFYIGDDKKDKDFFQEIQSLICKLGAYISSEKQNCTYKVGKKQNKNNSETNYVTLDFLNLILQSNVRSKKLPEIKKNIDTTQENEKTETKNKKINKNNNNTDIIDLTKNNSKKISKKNEKKNSEIIILNDSDDENENNNENVNINQKKKISKNKKDKIQNIKNDTETKKIENTENLEEEEKQEKKIEIIESVQEQKKEKKQKNINTESKKTENNIENEYIVTETKKPAPNLKRKNSDIKLDESCLEPKNKKKKIVDNETENKNENENKDKYRDNNIKENNKKRKNFDSNLEEPKKKKKKLNENENENLETLKPNSNKKETNNKKKQINSTPKDINIKDKEANNKNKDKTNIETNINKKDINSKNKDKSKENGKKKNKDEIIIQDDNETRENFMQKIEVNLVVDRNQKKNFKTFQKVKPLPAKPLKLNWEKNEEILTDDKKEFFDQLQKISKIHKNIEQKADALMNFS